MRHLNIQAAKEGRTSIDIIGQIGESFFEDGNTLETVKSDIEAIDTPLDVNLASLGGSAFEGLAIHDLLISHGVKHEVAIHMIGATASAGVIIGSAASKGKLKITPNSLYLAHKSSSFAFGNVSDMKDQIDLMEKVDTRMVKILTRRSEQALEDGKALTATQMEALMDEDKFITAEEAKEKGLVDEVSEDTNIAATVDIDKVMASKDLTKEQKELIKTQFTKAPKPAATKENVSEWKGLLAGIKELITGNKAEDKTVDPDVAAKVKALEDKIAAAEKAPDAPATPDTSEDDKLKAEIEALQAKVNRHDTVETTASTSAPTSDPNPGAEPAKDTWAELGADVFAQVPFKSKK